LHHLMGKQVVVVINFPPKQIANEWVLGSGSVDSDHKVIPTATRSASR
jgi:hypothetical protein